MCVHLFYSYILFKALWGLHFIHIFYLKPSEGYRLKTKCYNNLSVKLRHEVTCGGLSHNANYIRSFFAGVSSITVSLLAQHTHWTCSTSLLPLPVKYASMSWFVGRYPRDGRLQMALGTELLYVIEKGFIDAYILGRQT